MIGMHGSRATNLAVDRADLLIALGVRFDDRATGSIAGFAPRARVIHMDIDEAEIGKIRRPDISAGVRREARAATAEQARCPRERREPGGPRSTRCAREHPFRSPDRRVAPGDIS